MRPSIAKAVKIGPADSRPMNSPHVNFHILSRPGNIHDKIANGKKMSMNIMINWRANSSTKTTISSIENEAKKLAKIVIDTTPRPLSTKLPAIPPSTIVAPSVPLGLGNISVKDSELDPPLTAEASSPCTPRVNPLAMSTIMTPMSNDNDIKITATNSRGKARRTV